MMDDEQIKSSLLTKKHAVIAPGWRIMSASDKKKDIKVANLVEQVLIDIPGAMVDTLLEIMSAFTYGYSITEIIWEPVKKGKFKGFVGIEDLKTKNPLYYEFDIDKYANIKPNGLILTRLGLEDKKLPIDKFIIWSYQEEFGNHYGRSDLRESYPSWWNKSFTIKAMSIWMERYASPLAVGKYRGSDAANKSKLERVLDRISTATSIVFPKDSFEVEFIESKVKGEARYLEAIRYFNTAIARSILIPDRLIAAGEKGAFAQAKVHFDMFVLNIQAIRRTLEELINDQLIKRLVDFNFSNIQEYPKFKFNPITDAEKRAFADAIIDGISKDAITKTLDVENFLRESLGMEKLPEGSAMTQPTKDTDNESDNSNDTSDETDEEKDRIKEKYLSQLIDISIKQKDYLLKYLETKINNKELTDKLIGTGNITLRLVGEFKNIVKKLIEEVYQRKDIPENYLNNRVNIVVDDIVYTKNSSLLDILPIYKEDYKGLSAEINKAFNRDLDKYLDRFITLLLLERECKIAGV